MNHKFSNSFYYQTESFQSIKLEYKNSDILTTIILPSKNIKINNFILNMNSNLFFDMSNYNSNRKNVNLFLPKIK
jgi:serine protease inhibitor